MIPWMYDLFLWVFSILVDLFFREVHPRGSWKVPRRGPVIFVAAPHANQVNGPLMAKLKGGLNAWPNSSSIPSFSCELFVQSPTDELLSS